MTQTLGSRKTCFAVLQADQSVAALFSPKSNRDANRVCWEPGKCHVTARVSSRL